MESTNTNIDLQDNRIKGETFNFVLDCTDAALEKYLAITAEDYAGIFTKGDLNWCLQTYHILAKRGSVAVKCSNCLLDNHINLIHSDQLLKVKGSSKQFVVCVRADYPLRPWAQYHVVQNVHQLTSDTSSIPHWVQPGLIKRQADRRGVKRVAYAGAPIKGNMAGSAESWKKMFEPYGIEFVLLPSGSWHDLSTIDVLIGIRSFTTHPYHTKPPTKLFNAWHANIPFVGGYDSAFRQVGVPGEDYLLATTPEEAVSAVLQLRYSPALYADLVKRGQQKALQYSEDTIAAIWEKTLTGPIADRYKNWKRYPVYEQIRFNLLQKVGLGEHTTKQLVKQLLNKNKISPLLKKALY